MEKMISNVEKINDVMPNNNMEINAPSELNDVSEGCDEHYIDDPVSQNTDSAEGSKDKVYIITKNESLEGDVHPITGVTFERMTIDVGNEIIEGVFPEFDSVFETEIPEDMFFESDRKQFDECNNQLSEEINNNSELYDNFSSEQIEQIRNGETPDGYVWHHDAEPGKMVLVDFETHASTGHTGGRYVWGGGTENR